MRLRLRGWHPRRPSDARAVSGATDGRGACTIAVRHRRSTDPSCRHLGPHPSVQPPGCVRSERLETAPPTPARDEVRARKGGLGRLLVALALVVEASAAAIAPA